MTTPVPYYTPIQIQDRNACSHECNPQGEGAVSFYIYPCKTAHLAHSGCFLEYCKREEAKGACKYCIREFGVTPTIEEKGLENYEKGRTIKIVGISLFLGALIFTFLYVFLWPKS